MALISLVYVSYATRKFDMEDLRALLENARDNNRKLNITGMLLYRDGFFIQALEGDEKKVMELYQQIAVDPRHDRVIMVYKGKIAERTFPSWSMGFNPLDDVDFSNVDGYKDMSQEEMTPQFLEENPSRTRNLINAFKNQTYF